MLIYSNHQQKDQQLSVIIFTQLLLDYFQEMLRQLFPSWLEIRKYEEVVAFVCGLMKDPRPLIDHVYESYIEWTLDVTTTNSNDEETERQLEFQGKIVTDLNLLHSLYAESSVPLPGSP